jgi:uncharacterized protein YqgV (UPF0045/DUF77 family)
VAHIEFTVEPFVEGRPGPHVTAAIDAARGHGLDVDIGPFGSSCWVEVEQVGAVVAAITDAALAHGATHVNVHVGREAPTGRPAFELPRQDER